MVDRDEDLVRRYYGEALNPGRFELLDELLTADFLDHEELRGIPPTRDGLKQKYAMLRAGFPDFGFTVEDLFSTGDRVAVRLTVRGTHDGVFMARPPTGRQFVVGSVGIFRTADSRIVEHWGVFDQLAMLGQTWSLGRLRAPTWSFSQSI
jgi:predicted ester cyclase